MKKYLLGFLFILSVVCFANGYGFDLETGVGYSDSDYDEYGINKKTGQTREYERKIKKEKSKNYYETPAQIVSRKIENREKSNSENNKYYDRYSDVQVVSGNFNVLGVIVINPDPDNFNYAGILLKDRTTGTYYVYKKTTPEEIRSFMYDAHLDLIESKIIYNKPFEEKKLKEEMRKAKVTLFTREELIKLFNQ
jgi:hypothetical protein